MQQSAADIVLKVGTPLGVLEASRRLFRDGRQQHWLWLQGDGRSLTLPADSKEYIGGTISTDSL